MVMPVIKNSAYRDTPYVHGVMDYSAKKKKKKEIKNDV